MQQQAEYLQWLGRQSMRIYGIHITHAARSRHEIDQVTIGAIGRRYEACIMS